MTFLSLSSTVNTEIHITISDAELQGILLSESDESFTESNGCVRKWHYQKCNQKPDYVPTIFQNTLKWNRIYNRLSNGVVLWAANLKHNPPEVTTFKCASVMYKVQYCFLSEIKKKVTKMGNNEGLRVERFEQYHFASPHRPFLINWCIQGTQRINKESVGWWHKSKYFSTSHVYCLCLWYLAWIALMRKLHIKNET